MPAAFSFSCERQRLIVESATEIRRLRVPGFARQLVRHLTPKRVIGSRFLLDDSRREFHLLGDQRIHIVEDTMQECILQFPAKPPQVQH